MKYKLRHGGVVEAIKYTGDNYKEVQDFMNWPDESSIDSDLTLNVLTTIGMRNAPIGWYIAKDESGNVYPCSPEIFDFSLQEVK